MKTMLAAALAVGLCGITAAQEKDKPKADPVGTWKLEYDIGGQKRDATLKVKKDGEKFAGTMTWPDQKEAKLADVKFKDTELTFTAEREIMDNKLMIEYKLKVDGDKLTGKAAVDVGGEKREFDIEGKREKEKKD
ncbi:MAG TPA: hypothetical protein VM529_12150 [Gemmata sp.]|nr:hypothetical protein [Gemmata sp.]